MGDEAVVRKRVEHGQTGSFMLIRRSLGRPVSREVGWEGALDAGRPSDYSPSMNNPEVSMAPRLHGPVAVTAPDAETAAAAVPAADAVAAPAAVSESDSAE